MLLDEEEKETLRSLCWETMFGQELTKLTVMDFVLTAVSTVIGDFLRAVIVRYEFLHAMNLGHLVISATVSLSPM